MKNLYVEDLANGTVLVGETFAVLEAKLAETKDKKPYYKVTLADRTGNISGQIWSDSINNVQKDALKPGKVVAIEGRVEEYKSNLQLNITRVSSVDETKLDEFMEGSDFDLEELWQNLQNHIAEIQDANLQKYVASIFADSDLVKQFKTMPAAEYIHHSFQGGLLEHVNEMLDLSKPLRKYYPEANFDLVTVGIILHDIGKLRELEIVGTVVQRTKEGYLIGHLIKSYEFLLETSKGILSEQQVLQLKHIVLSHHGLLEYGSPVVPGTIEAEIVNSVDEVSSKVRIFQKVLRKNKKSAGEFSDWDNILRTRVFLGDKSIN